MPTYRIKGARGLSVSVPLGGSGDVVGPAASVASEVALFDGVTGKLLKRAASTGIAKLTAGVLATVTTWATAALTGTASRLAGFDAGGLPTDYAVGSGAGTICAGNDSRLSDSRAPNGAAGGDLNGNYPNPGVAKLAGTTPSAYGLTLIDDVDAATARTTLGLGSIATQAANNVAITGGSITGITDLAVADGGTGSSTAAGALANLGGLAASLLTTKGDILSYTTVAARLAAGADGRILVADSTNAAGLVYRLTPAMQLLYGGADDGALALDGAATITVDGLAIAPVANVYTLVADLDGGTVTFSGTASLKPAGYFVRCHKLTGEAANTIHDNGNAASGITAGAALAAAGTTYRAAVAGAAGRTTLGAGAASSVQTFSYGGTGGNGGAGGASPGGNSPANTIPPTNTGRQSAGIPLLYRYGAATGAGADTEYRGGGGGSAGGNAAGVGNSGGGGGGGGCLAIYAAIWDFAGNVTCTGGAGGNAATGVNGGGGGGGGGDALRVYEVQLRAPASFACAGGAGGSGSAGGSNGANGAAGKATTRAPIA